MFADPRRPANTARFVYLDPRAPDFYVDWDKVATDSVAILRSEAGRNPYDRDLSDLVGELSTQSELFRTRWAAHNVRSHDTGSKRFHHPVVGDLEPDVRDDDARRRHGADDVRLHRRGRLEVRGGAEPPRELDRDTRTRQGDDRCRSRAAALTPWPGRATGSPATVYIDAVAAPSGTSHADGELVHFTPGARTAWHTHPNGQTIFVLEGVGHAQRRGGPVEIIRPGDRVFFEPGEEHWHGAAATRFMAHLAMVQVDDEGNSATWLDHVTDDEYAAAPALDA